MKFVLALSLLIVACLAADDCHYQSEESKNFYDLSSLADLKFKYYDQVRDEVVYWSFCGQPWGLEDCDPSAAVCVRFSQSQTLVNAGSAMTEQWNDLVAPGQSVESGVEITYGDGDECNSTTGTRMKTTFQISCDLTSSDRTTLTVQSMTEDGCYRVITASSAAACPTFDNWDEPSVDPHTHVYFSGVFFLALCVCVCLTACLCCCCCCRRKKNIQKKQTQEMSTFQPYTYAPLNQDPAAVPPVVNPTAPQQQYVFVPSPPPYFYVNPQQQQQSQNVSDEQYARQLQEAINKGMDV